MSKKRSRAETDAHNDEHVSKLTTQQRFVRVEDDIRSMKDNVDALRRDVIDTKEQLAGMREQFGALRRTVEQALQQQAAAGAAAAATAAAGARVGAMPLGAPATSAGDSAVSPALSTRGVSVSGPADGVCAFLERHQVCVACEARVGARVDSETRVRVVVTRTRTRTRTHMHIARRVAGFGCRGGDGNRGDDL